MSGFLGLEAEHESSWIKTHMLVVQAQPLVLGCHLESIVMASTSYLKRIGEKALTQN
jgi:hypothetical protein